MNEQTWYVDWLGLIRVFLHEKMVVDLSIDMLFDVGDWLEAYQNLNIIDIGDWIIHCCGETDLCTVGCLVASLGPTH